jgi:replicative DNA helicase
VEKGLESTRLNLETAVVPSSYQGEVLSYLVKDRDVLGRFVDIITEENFENPIHRTIYHIVREHFTRFINVPSKKVVEREVEALLSQSQQGFVPAASFWREMDIIYRTPTADRDYVIEKISLYIIKSTLGILAENALRAAEQDAPKLDDVAKSITDLYGTISGRLKEKGEFLLGQATERIRENPAIEKIPMGLRASDRVLGGGLGKGELGIMIAPSGYGKSHFLVTVGANALRVRKNVMHVSLEISKRNLISRYEAFNTKIPKGDLYNCSGRVVEKLLRLRRLVQADVYVMEFPTRSLSVNQLRSVLTQTTVAKNFYPDLLIVDYGDILKPEGLGKEATMYSQQKVIFEQLRGIAQEFDLPIWTASQANKNALGKEIVTIKDIAESFGKVQVADVVGALCQTEQEQQEHRGRFYWEKVRETKGHVKVNFITNFDFSYFQEGPDAAAEEVYTDDIEFAPASRMEQAEESIDKEEVPF